MTDLPFGEHWQLGIMAFGFFMQSLDTTIITVAGLLLRMFGQQHLAAGNTASQRVFLHSWPCMALIFVRVPDDTSKNVIIARRKRRES